MKDYTLSEKFALLGMDGLDSVHGTVAKKAVIKGIKAAQILEEMLDGSQEPGDDIGADELESKVKEIKELSNKKREELEKEMFRVLSGDGSMVEVQDLMACDMYYETAGMQLRQYRSLPELYLKITQEIRAEILEEGDLTTDCVIMLWLLRETGIMHDIFSSDEQVVVERRLTEVCARETFYSRLFSQEFHSGMGALSLRFLKLKSSLFTNPYLEGVNLLFPFLERRKAIFIDMVVFQTTVWQRRENTAAYLRERGHLVEEVPNGEEVLLKIDNAFYRVFPMTKVFKLPIQGISLTPFYR